VLPVVRVLGRSQLGGTLTQLGVEELVFGLPAEYGVMFWRARTEGPRLRIQIEVGERHRAPAARLLRDAVGVAYGIEAEVEASPPGALVPAALLTAAPDVMKPRGLFGEGENWDKALQYY
jgi:phenylacetate-CoA ligase